MKKVFKLSILLTLGLANLAGCSSNIPLAPNGTISNSANDDNYLLASDGTPGNLNALPGVNQSAKGIKGEHEKDGPGRGMGYFPAELNLTADQKTQLEALRKTDKPAKPDQSTMDANKTAMDAVRKEISDAFISDNFDAVALKAKLDALKPAKPNNDDRITAEANILIKTYNILTAEQRAILETKQAEMANAAPKTKFSPPANFDPAKMADNLIAKLSTELGLNETQKVSLKVVLQPPAPPDFQAEQAKRKATHDAINAELKTGNASVDRIVAILKANAPADMGQPKGDELDKLAKIHAILNADQRKKFIESKKGFAFGPGGPGKKGPGNFGGNEGPGGMGHGPGGPGGMF